MAALWFILIQLFHKPAVLKAADANNQNPEASESASQANSIKPIDGSQTFE